MQSYVAGFLFSPDLEQVVLIKKNRPGWQAGRLNGVGGKVEKGETPGNAMDREFLEETGQKVTSWIPFCTLRGTDFTVSFFYNLSEKYTDVISNTDEVVFTLTISDVMESSLPLPNVKWLIQMAIAHWNNLTTPEYTVFELPPTHVVYEVTN